MSEKYVELENLTLYYDPQNSMAEAVWNGFLSGDILKNAVTECLNLIDNTKPEKWLADNRKLKALRQHDQEWLEATLLPRLANSSLLKIATLISEDIFNQMAIEKLYSKATENSSYDHQYFKLPGLAKKWLLED